MAEEKVVAWWFAVGSESMPRGEGMGNWESNLELKNEDPTEDIGEKSFS
ncbi:MAG: hypothetical protein ACMG6E_09610 [Candidatus Roizmanbacteria bacterium]